MGLIPKRTQKCGFKTREEPKKQNMCHSLNNKQNKYSKWNSQFSDSASTSSSSSWNSSSCSGRSYELEKRDRFGPTLRLESGYKRDCWGQRVVTTYVQSEGDVTPRFSGMSLGDVMRVTVLKEMDKLNMNKSKPMDLSCKPWNLKKL
eukprot:TRINITY_DN13403_c0_g1_i2.p1 TRINITY_DN13403_c0_g1~~TRINITY_DN13403_c0_g1_i2.p1  ORF type:complete len:147 (-),score=6.55 TRINITY_DN13403_c0_g1_i2:87-527(-)